MAADRSSCPSGQPLTRRRFLRTTMAGAAACLAGAAGSSLASARTRVPIAAAASLRHVLPALIADFAAVSPGPEVLVATYGSTGNLVRQMRQGAPFELLLAADEDYPRHLVESGEGAAPATVYAIGRLALLGRKGGPVPVAKGLSALAEALQRGRITRFAIANPEHAPYGVRAREALQRSGLWAPLQGRLVLAENVAQAVQFVSTGAAEAGIGAAALLAAPGIASAVDQALIPAALHAPLRQSMVLTRRASPLARSFHDYLGTPAARAVLTAHGLGSP